MMEQLLYLSTLFDLYGALLTEKQQECLRMHLFEDFSLSEIGEELGISRQAVYDNIHRSEKAMESYEKKQPENAQAVDEVLNRLEPYTTQVHGQEVSV